MNKESKSYTLLYTMALVMIVGSALAYTAITLKDRQQANIDADKMRQILASVRITPAENLHQHWIVLGERIEENFAVADFFCHGSVCLVLTGKIFQKRAVWQQAVVEHIGHALAGYGCAGNGVDIVAAVGGRAAGFHHCHWHESVVEEYPFSHELAASR